MSVVVTWRALTIASVGVAVTAAVLSAQMAKPVNPPHYAHPGPQHRDNGVSFCLLRYPATYEHPDSGSGWNTDFPSAGDNFLTRWREVTAPRRVSRQWVVDVGSPELFLCPLVMASDVGHLALSRPEADNLRRYLVQGGFLWVDDFWGTASWDAWWRELGSVLPPGAELVTPHPDHPLYRMAYPSEALQVSNADYWRPRSTRPEDAVREKGDDSPPTAPTLALDATGRPLILMTHNTDIGDTWEREADPSYFDEFGPRGYAFGINVWLYVMTH